MGMTLKKRFVLEQGSFLMVVRPQFVSHRKGLHFTIRYVFIMVVF